MKHCHHNIAQKAENARYIKISLTYICNQVCFPVELQFNKWNKISPQLYSMLTRNSPAFLHDGQQP